MKKKIIAGVLALVFTTATAMVAYAFTCEVTNIDGDKVTVKCKAKDAKKMKVGKKLKVKKKTEGC